MNGLRRMLWKCVSLVSICALLMPSMALAKPLNPDTVREKIVKRGVGSWVCVDEQNGLLLIGRIASINQDSFGIQLQNYPDITQVQYADVTRLRFGLSRGGVGILIGASVGAAVIVALVMHHEFEENKAQFPTAPPTLP
jgi:hypothetical protein